jgi:hypothetical protein
MRFVLLSVELKPNGYKFKVFKHEPWTKSRRWQQLTSSEYWDGITSVKR